MIEERLFFNGFPVPFRFIEGTETVTVNEEKTIIRGLIHDPLPFDPIAEMDCGEFGQYDPRLIHFSKEKPEKSDRVFNVAHNGAVYRIDDDGKDGFFIVPGDIPDCERRKYAESVMETYNCFCTGEVYGVFKWTYNRDKELIEQDEVWGYYGFLTATIARGEL